VSSANAMTIRNSDLLCCDGITKIENNSDSYMNRARVYFDNGEELSIIFGKGSHGSENGLFEIMCKQEFYDDEWQDGVRGYLTVEEVKDYIRKIAAA